MSHSSHQIRYADDVSARHHRTGYEDFRHGRRIMDLAGKHVVIIGGSSGMGLTTAVGAAAAGARVTIASTTRAWRCRPGHTARRLRRNRHRHPQRGIGGQGSPTSASWITWCTPPATGVAPRPLTEAPTDEARQLFEVRFWGAVTAVKHAAPRIKAGGSIVLTSGMVAVRPSAGTAIAASGAAAIEGLARGLAVELAPVRVNAVRPGAVRTPAVE